MRKLLLIGLSSLLLSACYARQLVLDDPLGSPLDSRVIVLSLSNQDLLGRQLEQSLLRELPRERGVSVVNSAVNQDHWQLQLQLVRRSSLMTVPLTMMGPPTGAERVRLELELTGDLVNSQSQKTVIPLHLFERGDSILSEESNLEQELLRRLKNRLIQDLQPRYSYR